MIVAFSAYKFCTNTAVSIKVLIKKNNVLGDNIRNHKITYTTKKMQVLFAHYGGPEPGIGKE